MKIASFNVKWVTPAEDRYSKIIHIFNQHQFDIICLQEVTKNTYIYIVEDIQKKLNFQDFYHCLYRFGVLILSKHPYRPSSTRLIPIGGHRGAILTEIILNHEIITITATHLDHLDEDIRIKQIEILKPHLLTTDFFIGDMNAINLEDYSHGQHININKSRAIAGLPLARNDTIDTILKCGFQINKFIQPTCPYQTRVDYIFRRPKNQGIDSVIDTITPKLSDHNLIIYQSNEA